MFDPNEAEDDLLPWPQYLVDRNVADSSDEEKCAGDLDQTLFPIFTQPLQAKAVLGRRRK